MYPTHCNKSTKDCGSWHAFLEPDFETIAVTSAAVAFTVDPFTPWNDATQSNLRLENKRAADSLNRPWHQVREETVTLKDVNIVTHLNRARYAYRLSLRPAPSDTQQSATFPFYLEVPAQALCINKREDMCPPEIGAFSLVQQLQCQTKERQQTSDTTSAGQVAAMLGGTFVAALLVYSLLPYVKASNQKRRRSRLRTTKTDRLSRCSDQSDIPTTPTTAGRRIWGNLNGDIIEPAGAYRDEHRQRKKRQPDAVNGDAVSDAVLELLLAKLPDFSDERGWRDFFDSQIYYNDSQGEQRAATKIESNITSQGGSTPRDSMVATQSNKICQMKIASTPASALSRERYRTIRDRIDRAAMEAAIDEAQSFNEFWQM